MHLVSDMESRHLDLPKTKFIYVSGHSRITPSIDYVGPFPQTEFVNLVEPDTLSFETPESLRAIQIFSRLDDDTRERVLKPFLKDFRFFRTRPDLRHNFVSKYPYINFKVMGQTFSFGKEKGLMQGIWDLDEVRENPELFNPPSIFGRVISDDEKVELNIVEIVHMTKERYPRNPLIFILTGCRVIITPERAKQLEEVKDDPEAYRRLVLSFERKPHETTPAALGEGLMSVLNITAGKDDGPDKMEDDSDQREEEEERENQALWDSLMYPPEPMEGIKGGYRRRRGSKKRNMGSKSKAKGKKPKRREKSKSKAKTAKGAKIMSKTKTKRKRRVKV